MNCLVTGGAGFIGSNLVDRLLSEGHSVTVIDNESSDAHDIFYWNDKTNNYKYDVSDYVMCSDVFKRHKPDIIFHLAAEARIQNCLHDPVKAYETNLIGTLNMLQLCKKHNVKRLVLSTTSAIYGLKNTGPLVETMEPDCLNSYSTSKCAAEQACKLYSNSYGIDTVCLRYFNVYGPRQPKKGQYAPVIGVFKRQKEHGDPLTVVGDGEQTRDYVHVNDVVNANLLAAYHQTNLNGEIFNVGTGKNYSVNWIAEKIQKDTNKISYIPPRDGEARHTLANYQKINNVFNWKPSIDLNDYLIDT
jgi:UDP-glucose 4-epimerase